MQDDFGLSCPCGSENFERVVVHRHGQPDYVTEFVACVLCKVMFHLPVERSTPNSTMTRRSRLARARWRR